MKRSILPSLLAASALATALGGCGQEQDQTLASQIAYPLAGTAVKHDPRIMPVTRPGASGVTKTAPLAKLLYYGGHVVSNAKVVPVYWGTGTMISSSDMRGFYTAVVNNPYLDWLTEYNTNIKAVDGSTGTNQTIGRGTVDAKDYNITPSIKKTALTDADIQTELGKQIDSKVLPAPDANTIYMMHFPLHTTIDLGGSGSCTAFCAYHNTLSKGGQSVFYAVLPFMGTGSGCEGGCGTSPTDLGNQGSVSSHELIETITDGEIGLVGGSIGPPAAWYDSANGEIGDICNAEQGTLPGTTYTIQKEWSNKAGACIVTAGTCTPVCTGKSCGSDGCGGSCGTCPTGDSCSSAGACVPACVPACTGKTCGSDGCGGTCGTCPSGQACGTGGTCTGGGGTCAHDKCKTGKKLKNTCDPCVQTICSFDSYCCATKWDAECVAEVADFCGETC